MYKLQACQLTTIHFIRHVTTVIVTITAPRCWNAPQRLARELTNATLSTVVCNAHVVIVKCLARQALTSLISRVWLQSLGDVHIRAQTRPVETTGREISRVGPQRTQASTQPVAMATRVVAFLLRRHVEGSHVKYNVCSGLERRGN